jgi:putative NADPH-quinone reductase
LEWVLRPGFASAARSDWGFSKKLLAGKSARIVVTMGMPALFYRWYFRAHSVKTTGRNILKFRGTSPVRVSIGGIEAMGAAGRGG